MRIACAALLLAVLLPFNAVGQNKQPKRQFYPDAPEVPILTKQETAYVHSVLQAMVLDDLGLPKNQPRNRAAIRKNFESLGIEALPILIEWMVYSANHYGTCPCTVIGQKIMRFVVSGTSHRNADTILFIEQRLGKGLVTKKPPESYKDLAHNVSRHLKIQRQEEYLTLKTMKFAEALELAKGIEAAPAPRRLDKWRVVVGFIGEQKKQMEAFEFLFDILSKAETSSQQKTINDALRVWADAKSPPTESHLQGPLSESVVAWRAWKEARRGK